MNDLLSLAHIRRHDFLVNLWQIVIETLFFYLHPAGRPVDRRGPAVDWQIDAASVIIAAFVRRHPKRWADAILGGRRT